MLRYTSAPDVTIDVHNGGSVFWETFHRVVEIAPDHSARYSTERLECSPGLGARTQSVIRGRVTSLVPGYQMTVRFQRADSDKALTLNLVAGPGKLVGEIVSTFNDSRHGIILTPDVPGALFPDPLPSTASPDPVAVPTASVPPAPVQAPTASSPPAAAPVMTLVPGAPADGDAFRAPWARLNRHLRRHQGRASALRLKDLSESEQAFLARLFSGPLDTLEQDALDDLRDFYAAEPNRRLNVNVTSLDLPTAPGGAWRITLGEAAWGGVVIVYDLAGWDVVDRTLVG